MFQAGGQFRAQGQAGVLLRLGAVVEVQVDAAARAKGRAFDFTLALNVFGAVSASTKHGSMPEESDNNGCTGFCQGRLSNKRLRSRRILRYSQEVSEMRAQA